MSIWDDITNGAQGISNIIGSGLGGLSNFVLGSDANAVNGTRPIGDLNILGKLAEAVQGPAEINRYQDNYNLKKLGSDLNTGNIDQAQYLKGLAQYSPETYNKILTAQMQTKPAAIKNFEDLQSLVKNGEAAQAQGDIPLATKYYEQADSLNGIIRPQLVNTNTYSSRLSGQPISQPTGNSPIANPNKVTAGSYPSLQGDNTIAKQDLAPIPGSNSPLVASNNSAASSQPMPANEILNNTKGLTDAEKVVASIPNASISSPTPPTRKPGQTEQQYRTDLKVWEDKNASYQSEQKANGPATAKFDTQAAADAEAAKTIISTIAEMRQATKQMQSGLFEPAKQTIVRIARGAGVSLSDSDVANLTNQQVLTKLANDALGSVLKNDGQAGRLKVVADSAKAANPNISMEPESLGQLLDIMQTKAAPPLEKYKAWSEAKKANPSLTSAQFSREYLPKTITEQEKAGGNLPGYKGDSIHKESFPQGTKFNPDGSLVLPDGRVIRKKQ